MANTKCSTFSAGALEGNISIILNDLLFTCRGMASIVRKCLEKSTGAAFAVKIVDITTEHQSEEDAQRLKTETKDEVEILRLLQGHPNISRFSHK
jgi:hypothetical protein